MHAVSIGGSGNERNDAPSARHCSDVEVDGQTLERPTCHARLTPSRAGAPTHHVRCGCVLGVQPNARWTGSETGFRTVAEVTDWAEGIHAENPARMIKVRRNKVRPTASAHCASAYGCMTTPPLSPAKAQLSALIPIAHAISTVTWTPTDATAASYGGGSVIDARTILRTAEMANTPVKRHKGKSAPRGHARILIWVVTSPPFASYISVSP